MPASSSGVRTGLTVNANTRIVLTEAGHALLPVLAAMSAWGDVYQPSGFRPAALYTDRESGTPLRLAFVDADGNERDLAQVEVVRGPGARSVA